MSDGGARRATRALLIVEVALACTLLVGGTVLVRSFVNLARADRGIDPRGVITATFSLPPAPYPDAAARLVAVDAIDRELRALPGIARMAWSMGLPPGGGGISFGNWQPDRPGAAPVDMVVEQYQVGPDFFDLYGLTLLEGRRFQAGDTVDQVIVGERFAQALWPGENPLGRTATFMKSTVRVVGVAREIHHPSLDPRVDLPEIYRPFRPGGSYAMLSLRCAGPCPDAKKLRQHVRAVAPAVQVVDAGPLEARYLEDLARPRAAASAGLAFAVISLIAAGAGLFSVLSYAVGRRRREFGIRTALGATPTTLRRLVLRDGAIVTIAGVAMGAIAAMLLARTIASLEYGVSMADPLVWALSIGLIATTVLLASWRPARAAARVDPVELLRSE